MIVISSDIKGKGSRLQVTGGTANSVLGFSTDTKQGSGNVGNIDKVTLEEVKESIEWMDSRLIVDRDRENRLRFHLNTSDPSASLQIGTDTSEGFGFDNEYHEGTEADDVDVFSVGAKDPGSHGNKITVEIAPPSSGNFEYGDLVVKVDGVVKERFRDVSIDQNDPRYVVDVIGHDRLGSSYIGLVDMRASEVSDISEQVVQLGFGEDGLDGLDDLDFIGSEAGKTGLYALDSIQDLSLIMVPGRATPAVHDAMLQYCEIERAGLVFAVLDPPSDLSAVAVKDYVRNVANLMDASEYGAIYWPWLKIVNPSKTVFGQDATISVPPSGIVCGIYARNDSGAPGGLYQPPAGVEAGRVFGVVGFDSPDVLEESKRDIVYPSRINPITTTPGNPIYIDGSRTLKSNGQFPYVAEKRGVIFVKQSLKSGLEFARHRNNDSRLRAEVFRTIKAFLLVQMNNGAFRYTEPEKAFQIEISEDPLDIMNHQLRGKVLLATNKAVDWVVIEIGQDLRDLGEL